MDFQLVDELLYLSSFSHPKRQLSPIEHLWDVQDKQI